MATVTSGDRERENQMTAPEGYIPTLAADAVPDGGLVQIEVDGEPRLLVKVNGRIYCVYAICTHEEADLADGDLEDTTIYCPLHGSGFDLETGAVRSLPATHPLPVYDVQILDGTIYVSRDPKYHFS